MKLPCRASFRLAADEGRRKRFTFLEKKNFFMFDELNLNKTGFANHETEGAFHLPEQAEQILWFVNGMHQFEGYALS